MIEWGQWPGHAWSRSPVRWVVDGVSKIPAGNPSHNRLHEDLRNSWGAVVGRASERGIINFNQAHRLHHELEHSDATHPVWDWRPIDNSRGAK